MLGSLSVRACDWAGVRLVRPHRALHRRLQRAIATYFRVSGWQWAGRAGWVVAGAYAATVVVWAVMRYGG